MSPAHTITKITKFQRGSPRNRRLNFPFHYKSGRRQCFLPATSGLRATYMAKVLTVLEHPFDSFWFCRIWISRRRPTQILFERIGAKEPLMMIQGKLQRPPLSNQDLDENKRACEVRVLPCRRKGKKVIFKISLPTSHRLHYETSAAEK